MQVWILEIGLLFKVGKESGKMINVDCCGELFVEQVVLIVQSQLLCQELVGNNLLQDFGKSQYDLFIEKILCLEKEIFDLQVLISEKCCEQLEKIVVELFKEGVQGVGIDSLLSQENVKNLCFFDYFLCVIDCFNVFIWCNFEIKQ